MTYELVLKASGGLDGGGVTSKQVKGLEFCRHRCVKILRRVRGGVRVPGYSPSSFVSLLPSESVCLVFFSLAGTHTVVEVDFVLFQLLNLVIAEED